jgi:hypothetical protein
MAGNNVNLQFFLHSVKNADTNYFFIHGVALKRVEKIIIYQLLIQISLTIDGWHIFCVLFVSLFTQQGLVNETCMVSIDS